MLKQISQRAPRVELQDRRENTVRAENQTARGNRRVTDVVCDADFPLSGFQMVAFVTVHKSVLFERVYVAGRLFDGSIDQRLTDVRHPLK
jgi:hypothetical protein